MYGADGGKERFGRALRVAALVVSLLALVAVVGPRLASSGGGGAPSSTSLPSGPEPEATTTSGSPAEPTVTAAPATTSTSPAASSTTTTLAPGPTATVPDQGEVDLTLAGLHAGTYGPSQSGFFAGDTIGWHFRVTNRGNEYLWGVFVYLELYGPVACGARRLAVGESTDCWAETTAMAGANEADAWVTAWTALRMVTDRLSHRVLIPAT